MAIAPTGDIYKVLNFAGSSSRSYGVYITGSAVYNAPQRDVEMKTIPGRNGAFVLDNGRFDNIEVTYPAGIFADSEADFAAAISNFRNFLCSKRGYCRLTDDYNPGEYRMAVYKSGLEVTPAQLRAGEFEITFECQPQRFLTSGENKISVASGDEILNPTLFASSPMLEIGGYGAIYLGDETVVMNNATIGVIVVADAFTPSKNYKNFTVTIDDTYANAGDAITLTSASLSRFIMTTNTPGAVQTNPPALTGTPTASISDSSKGSASASIDQAHAFVASVSLKTCSFQYGTAKTISVTGTYTCGVTGHGTQTATLTFSVAYDGSDTFTFTVSETNTSYLLWRTGSARSEQFLLDSSTSIMGNPVYIDLDIGEAYKIESGSVVSLNSGVIFPAKLPTLKPGVTTITYDNTVTDLKVVPRWWKV